MKLKHFVCVVVVALAGCAGNPLKPDRPDGKRVPVNVTPPPVYVPAVPAATAPLMDSNASSAVAGRKGGTHG